MFRRKSYRTFNRDSPPPENMGKGKLKIDKKFIYSIYVLLLLSIAYLLNQLDRYMLAIVARPMAQEIQYGDMACFRNSSLSDGDFDNVSCTAENKNQCEATKNINGSYVCEWNYNGQGFKYQLLAGPLFIVIYTFVGIPVSFAADQYNRTNFLAVSVIFWSVMTLLMGFVKNYWHLAVLRFGQGIGEAGCTPFATSLIADYFIDTHRASALGVYNWGIYFGYSLSYALGNFITNADILGQGWRWSFIISGIPGVILGPIIFFTMMEPNRQTSSSADRDSSDDMENLLGKPELVETWCQKLKRVLKPFTQPTLILLVIAGSIRNGAGYVWAYNTQIYFEAIGQTKTQIGSWMSWVPLVGGSIGVVLGGFISDRIIKRVGPHARLLVLVISQLVAAPFVAGALFLHPYWAYVSLIPGNIIGEMWVGITLAVGLELVPSNIRASAVAVYLFIISNIGGNMPLLVPPLKKAFMNLGYSTVDSLRAALYILYPGMFVLGGLLFLVTMISLKRDLRRNQELGVNKSGLRSSDDESEAYSGLLDQDSMDGST